ncbi:lysophospholipid acyltransferase family protein [Jannaschia marina]|uniref:lysophospholipid acyltransferase family protein n=1 Tax=Jannaschia marina TaxID=2741674 RepID=UPI0015CDA276|nr:lysophospholipid acyltransferase family protein [Jannaschia marina]
MKQLSYWIQGLALRAMLWLVALLPLDRRRAVVAWVTERTVRLTPLRRRITRNLDHVWPDLPASARDRIVAGVGRNVGRSLTGIWFNADFARDVADIRPEGPGWQVLQEAEAEGRGAIVVSGHFGQWEAIRHVMKRAGMEAGAIYRPNNNPYYEPIFRAGIDVGGQPIIPKGRAGYRVMIGHLRKGGFMALLPDQRVSDGAVLPFLGRGAKTALAAAELALRYDIPLVPAFAPWEDGLRVVFEAPIPPSDPETMMAEFNARLGAWVERHPSQWHWLHRRWKMSARSRALES